ncbi:MAG: hypothetical protein EPO02_12840 [Nitrospirae bacterium]|nr:MAG: hypothetical protein EPO02_12840 [Nitrospirota bacterium]
MKVGFIFPYYGKLWIVNDNFKCTPWSLNIMAKEMKQKKEEKKAPLKSMKEKRMDKKKKKDC